mmetsp:Transcript_25663/g.48140  ORF Transcript_25663/g.48140 Transcript_25663/m.48140 type:complete len:300 (+) Transcript_25663:607-1506(+)
MRGGGQARSGGHQRVHQRRQHRVCGRVQVVLAAELQQQAQQRQHGQRGSSTRGAGDGRRLCLLELHAQRAQQGHHRQTLLVQLAARGQGGRRLTREQPADGAHCRRLVGRHPAHQGLERALCLSQVKRRQAAHVAPLCLLLHLLLLLLGFEALELRREQERAAGHSQELHRVLHTALQRAAVLVTVHLDVELAGVHEVGQLALPQARRGAMLVVHVARLQEGHHRGGQLLQSTRHHHHRSYTRFAAQEVALGGHAGVGQVRVQLGEQVDRSRAVLHAAGAGLPAQHRHLEHLVDPAQTL